MIRLALRVEAGLALILAWGLVFLVPIRLTGRLFGTMLPPGAAVPGPAPAPGALARARAVAGRVTAVASRLPWHSSCLVQAVAGRILLARRGIRGAAIRFGVRKTATAMEAHAWLLLGETILIGGAGADDYVPLADLADAGRPAPP